jgi:hypothetical protein
MHIDILRVAPVHRKPEFGFGEFTKLLNQLQTLPILCIRLRMGNQFIDRFAMSEDLVFPSDDLDVIAEIEK